MHVRVGLLDLVQQHHAVGPAAHRLGQHAAFAVADVARRRALQRGDGVRLLELAHVDGDDVLLAAVQGLGQRQRGLGLAHAGGAGQQEHADRLVRVVQPGARSAHLDALGDQLQRMALADHALVQRVGELQHRLHLVAHHAAQRDAGPVGDHRGHGLVVHLRQDQRRVALQRRELGAQAVQLVEQRRALGFGRCALPVLAQQRVQFQHAIDQALFLQVPGLEFRLAGLRLVQLRGHALLALGHVHADRPLAADDLPLDLQRLDAAQAVLDLGRRRRAG